MGGCADSVLDSLGMILLQVLGGHGAGKSTLLSHMVGLSDEMGARLEDSAGKKSALTVFPVDGRLSVLVGDYLSSGTKRCRGLDAWWGVKNSFLIDVLQTCVCAPEKYGFVGLEGITVMTRKWHDRYMQLGYAPRYMLLEVTDAISIERIGRSVRTASRILGAARLAAWLESQGAWVWRVDATAYPPDILAHAVLDWLRRDT